MRALAAILISGTIVSLMLAFGVQRHPSLTFPERQYAAAEAAAYTYMGRACHSDARFSPTGGWSVRCHGRTITYP